MITGFTNLPTDIVRLVIQILDILDLARLDSAMCDTTRVSSLLTALDGLLFDVSYSQTIEAMVVNPDARQWVQSRGVVLNRALFFESSMCFSILHHPTNPPIRPFKLQALYIIDDIKLTQSQWDQLWTQLHAGRIGLHFLSQLNCFERTPHLHNCILEATLTLSSISPKQLLGFLGSCKTTLQALYLSEDKNPLPEWNDYQNTDYHEEWPMLTELHIHGCRNFYGATVLTMCARNAVSLSKLTIDSTCLHYSDGLVALLQHQIWRPRNHILTINISIETPYSKLNGSHMSVFDLPQSWINDNPPITHWEVYTLRTHASKLHSFDDLTALLPLHQQRVIYVFLKLNRKGFPFLPHPVCYQSLTKIYVQVSEITTIDDRAGSTEMNWNLLWQSPCMTSLRLNFHDCDMAVLERIVTSLVDRATSHTMPPLQDVTMMFPTTRFPGSDVSVFSGQLATTFLTTLATSTATTLVFLYIIDVAVSSADVIFFLANCRSLSTFHIEDIHVFKEITGATTLIRSNMTTKQPCPEIRSITIGVRMPNDSTHHDVVWNSIRCIANIWNQHCSSYRNPTPKLMTVSIKSSGHSKARIVDTGSQALADMPYIKLQTIA